MIKIEPVIRVENLCFRYGNADRPTLNKLNFEVKNGEFFCIIGANGAGKSTLCNALVGLIPHYFTGHLDGAVHIFGRKVAEMSMGELVTRIGLVFQNPFNQLSYTASTVEEELAYGLGNLGIPRAEMKVRIERVAKLMRIDHILHKNPLELSGGQVQRVALGSSIIMEPQIIVLDECTSQLDPLGSEEIFDIIKELNQKGLTVILVDHDLERVARTADRILVLDQGEQVVLDTPERLFSDVRILTHKVGVPEFTQIGMALAKEDLYHGATIIREEQAVAAVKEAML